MQAGERRFARRLMSHLEDDYLCWYDQPVGTRRKYTDFVILHPNRGLLLLEVKDWKLESIHRINQESIELITPAGLTTVPNPYAQVRHCAYQLVNQLKGDPQLRQAAGKYQGGLVTPYGFGVVLSNITRTQFQATGLEHVLPAHRVICKDDMAESVEVEAFQERLWNMFGDHFSSVLTQPQIDRVRWHMFPEIRINPQLDHLEQGQDEDDVEIPDIVKVMDLQQEKIARGLGAGHRVIHGVAGSGKTMILAYRCVYLAKTMHKPILVLCYNVTLAAHLRWLMAEEGVDHRVNVYSFHQWCRTILKSYRLPAPAGEGEALFKGMVEAVIANTDKGHIPKGQYGAVLIDEGHDFEAEWLRLVVQMVDPDSNSFLLLYDDAQSIYSPQKRLGFSLKNIGIEAQGRTTVLKLNYRNTREILSFAYDVVDDYLEGGDKSGSKQELIAPDSAGLSGPAPVVMDFDSFEAEARYIVRLFTRLNEERGLAWRTMSALYCHNWMGNALYQAFTRASVPVQWMRSSAEKRRFDVGENSVKLMTMHSSKGLEFETVAACDVGYLGATEDRLLQDAKLLYVAMTRATRNLLLTSSKNNELTQKMHRAAAGLSSTSSEASASQAPAAAKSGWFSFLRSNRR